MLLPRHRLPRIFLKCPLPLTPLILLRTSGRAIYLHRWSSLLSRRMVFSTLCLVTVLRRYVDAPSLAPLSSLWVWYKSLHPLTAPNTAVVLCCVIEAVDPEKMPRAHEVQRMASSLAFMRTHSLEKVQSLGQWRSANSFCSWYLAIHVEDTPWGYGVASAGE